MAEAVRAQLKRLNTSSAYFKQQCVVGLFHVIRQSARILQKDVVLEAVAACLASRSDAAVEEAVAQMLLLVDAAGLGTKDAQTLLMDALTASSAQGAVSALAQGITDLFIRSITSGASPSDLGSSHPLITGLLSQPLSGQQLISSACDALAAAAQSNTWQVWWPALKPFLGHVMLQLGGSSSATAAAAALLQAKLIRLAGSLMSCSDDADDAAAPGQLLASFLLQHLQLAPLKTPDQRQQATSLAADLLDLLSTSSTAQEHHWQQLAACALQLAAQQQHSGGSIAEHCKLLAAISSSKPLLLQQHSVPLALLSLEASRSDTPPLMALLYRALSYEDSQQQGRVTAADAALMLHPAACLLALGTHDKAKRWGAHLMELLVQLQQQLQQQAPQEELQQPPASPSVGFQWTGELAQMQQARMVLLGLWCDAEDASSSSCSSSAAAAWCSAVASSLATARAKRDAPADGPFSVAVPKAEDEVAAQSISRPAALLLAALLAHPQHQVVAAAAPAVQELVLLVPAMAVPFLPLLLFRIRALAAAAPAAGGATSSAEAQLALLRVLPSMSGDATVAAFALRALAPLLSPSAPDVVRAAGLRLLVDTWVSSGRGWQRVEAALNGLQPAGSAAVPGLQLRLARAFLIRQVVQQEPYKGLELIRSIQECAQDSGSPAVAALGYEVLGAMCQADVLDFYKAWQLVHRWQPRPPEHPLHASRWVALLAAGAMDAAAHAEQAAAVLDLLWASTQHKSAEVRSQAYAALAGYPLELQDQLDCLRNLAEYTAPVARERSPVARAAAARLAEAALLFEHVHRRRQIGGGAAAGAAAGGAAGSREQAALLHRLCTTVPLMLCGDVIKGSSSSPAAAAAAASRPHSTSSPGALLLCFNPRPSQQQQSSSKSHKASFQQFHQLWADICGRLCWQDWSHPQLALQALQVFMARWVAASGGDAQAVLAAVAQPAAASQPAAALELPAVQECRLLAAAALAATGALSEQQVSEVHQHVVTSLQSPRAASTACAAMAALPALLPHMRPSDAADNRWAAAELLGQQLLHADSGGCVAAAAAALAEVCCQGCSELQQGDSAATRQLLSHALGMLLALLCYHQPQHVSTWQAVADLTWQAVVGGQPLGITLHDVVVSELDHSELEQTPLLQALLLALARVLAELAAAAPGSEILLRPVSELVSEQLSELARRCSVSGSSMTALEVSEACAALRALPITLQAGLSTQQRQGEGMKAVSALTVLTCADAVAAGLDGKVVGAAAESLCNVARLLLQQNVDPAAALGSSGSGAVAAMSALAARLQQLLQAGAKGPNPVALRTGALLAAAGLLGAQQQGPNLLSDPGMLAAARQLLKLLEAAAMAVGGDMRSAEVAAWALAAASYSCSLQRPAGGGAAAAAAAAASSSAPALKPLSAYPADGAMRPLAETVLAAVPGAGMSGSALAACIRVIASCPRLPAADWAALVRRAAGSETSRAWGAAAAEQLQCAALLLALLHGAAAGLGLASVLEEVTRVPARFRQLAAAARELLLQQLPQLLRCLPSGRLGVVLQGLPLLLPAAGAAAHSAEAAAVWRGLAGCAALVVQKDQLFGQQQMVTQLLGAMGLLLAELPLLPALLPGQLQQLVAEAKEEPAAAAAAAAAAAWPQWVAVLRCLKLLQPQQLLSLTELPPPSSSSSSSSAAAAVTTARAIQLRCCLVLLGPLSHRDLAPCRAAALDLPADLTAALLPALGLASCCAPQAAQVQLVSELLATGLVCARPEAALQLAAAVVACLQSQLGECAAVDCHVSIAGPGSHTLVGALSHTLPALLSDVRWAPAAEAVVGGFAQLLRRLQQQQQQQGEVVAGVVAGLCAVRDLVAVADQVVAGLAVV